MHTEPKDVARLAVGNVAVEILTVLQWVSHDFGHKTGNYYLNLGQEVTRWDAPTQIHRPLTQPPPRGRQCC